MSSIIMAASRPESLRSARLAMSGGKPANFPVIQNFSVCLSANVLITAASVIRHVTRVKET